MSVVSQLSIFHYLVRKIEVKIGKLAVHRVWVKNIGET